MSLNLYLKSETF